VRDNTVGALPVVEPSLMCASVSKRLIVAEEKKKEAENEDKEKQEGEEAGGEGAAAEGAGSAAAKKKKIMIITGAAVGALVLIVGGATFFLMGESKTEEKKEKVAEEVRDKPVYYPLGDMIVNLSGEGKRPNYLKVKVTLELANEKDTQLMDLIKPRIVDNFQVYLRELRMEDLRGSAGMYRLREELLMRVTEAAQPIRVRDVLFQEMLVQ
ncbi:MAG: flagellar basal body-associated FliL family protein, partial [Bdellovibrionales bacterium]